MANHNTMPDTAVSPVSSGPGAAGAADGRELGAARTATAAAALVAAGPRAARRRLAHRLLCLVPVALLLYWVLDNWRLVADGVGRLTNADPGWLALGLVLTALCWVAASCVRQGSIVERLPFGRLVASQFAAGSANQLLPAGIGAHAVTLRFLSRCGIPLHRGAAALALYTLAEAIVRTALLTGLIVAYPEALRLGELIPPGKAALMVGLATAALCTAVVVALLASVRLRRLAAGFLRTALTDARTLHRMPARMVALWGGSLAFPLLRAGVLICVGMSLGLAVPWSHLVIAYLAGVIAAGLVPAPGGIGSVEPALAVALVMVGSPLVLATATVIGFRCLTVWLPLLPGVAVLGLLIKRRVL
jgi:uncharacterized membrane protein YbhN (UPF0104 family)